ncbi:hypothetical protein V1520DRAFT_349285 [Lipomyces starkeyi]
MPSCLRKRSHFSEDMKVNLVQICVLHQNEYVRRRKSRSWRDISRLFEAKTGVPIRKPAQTVEILIRERREKLRYRSVIAQADTDLKHSVDVYMQRYDEVVARYMQGYERRRCRCYEYLCGLHGICGTITE